MVKGQRTLLDSVPQVGVRRHVRAWVNLLDEHGRKRWTGEYLANLLVAVRDGDLAT